jgi:glycosyltransferase involved in cell wall biosynthesis
MRILFVSHYATPHIGGIETVIHSLRRELQNRGHEVVHVASSASPFDLDELPLDDGVIRVPAINVLENKLGVPYPIFSPKLFRVLARELKQADVVHAHGLLYQSCVWALRYAKLRHRSEDGPVRVLTEHVGHVPYESRLLDHMESAAMATIGRLSVKAAESVVVLNRQIGAEVEALGPNGPVVQIPNGIDTDIFRPAHNGERDALRRKLGWDDGLPRVLFVGRLVAKKGLDTALEAAAAALGKFELVVAGPGPLQPESAPGVKVLGPLESERVAELYRAADALLLPSRGEGFPVTVQEAMASGLPVVMTNDPSYSHYLDGAGDGVSLVPPAPVEIARTLEALLADPEGLAAAGRAGHQHARGAFTWEQAAQRHERLYEGVLAARQLSGETFAPLPPAEPVAQATTASERGAIS